MTTPAPALSPWRISPLLRRILLVNALPLALIVAALLYLDQYQHGLLTAEVTALREQARIYAGALAESAVQTNAANQPTINPDLARPLLYRLIEPTPNAQALIYGNDGQVIANSRIRQGPGGAIITEPLPSVRPRGDFDRAVSFLYDQFLAFLPNPDIETTGANGAAAGLGWQPSVREALRLTSAKPDHQAAPFIRRAPDGRLLVTVAEPIIRSKQSVGVVLLTREATEVDRAVFAIRVSILGLFVLALVLTVLLSAYLARTIATPLLRLAVSASRLREGRAALAEPVPPAIAARQDEIGTLARALADSAHALWARMDAIERFAADVAHEIKNPLSSIRSAIETIRRMDDPVRAARLFDIIAQDVQRLDRLISDISDSSRLDSEMSRTAMEPVDLAPILSALAEIHDATRKDNDPVLVLDAPASGLTIRGAESRLVQVLRNLIGNAVSFSPQNGKIWLRGRETGNIIEIAVEDEGPGIPDAKLNDVFDRFYSERPQTESFGSHSGLGLSISRQIVEAHRGRITAENRRNSTNTITGARFVIRIPRG
ncbi:MAG: histidine kinase [Acidiphilium sp. 37-64-53]|uniref:sensor histidine kinase n=1 Tax=Acidiphilium TaxID=522 RepID=UPI000BD769D5|nr:MULTISPECIES: stimulus-sensing domain-containing protein [Acidiphilium]OYW03165.1 MAG: histidine kinase [Acidiphilium sp. 37-64-53]OZB28241.1 MAG: histidine kinase [Acidiphilium sp. 34-64-41]HQT85609.1 stimulus-sensing domain-containing protein [Acidiphilium rubrum]